MYNLKIRARNLVNRTAETLPSRIAHSLKIFVITIDDGQFPSYVKGFFKVIKRRKYIVVREGLEDWQKEAVIAHELGHYLLHRGYTAYSTTGNYISSKSAKEREANQFALELLSVSYEMEDRYIIKFLES